MKLDSLALKFTTDENFSQSSLKILDQTRLPFEEVWLDIKSTDQMIEAIKKLQVRGAPLIGVAAALQLAHSAIQNNSISELKNQADQLFAARPTAVNLMNCIYEMQKKLETDFNKIDFIKKAISLFHEDVKLCEDISLHGADLIQDGDQILTHCNTGGLATAGLGTALAVIIKAHNQGKKIHVYVDETRPLLQGARLTTWELQKHNIPMTLIADNMAAHLMSLGKIHKAFVGSDRIAQNGDFANKIGTYSVAVNCFYHKIPFYVVAPYTTVDFKCPSGKYIPIEQRASDEITDSKALSSTPVYNPAFDVTPAHLVTGWIMNTGYYRHQDIENGIFRK